MKRYGKAFTIVSHDDEFDPVTGETQRTDSSTKTIGIYTQLPDTFRNDGEVKESDKGAYLLDEPTGSDVIDDNGVEYQVVRTVRIGTGNTDAFFLCQLRK